MIAANQKYVDPTLDWSFKKMFLSPDHRECLIAFLNDMLQGEFVVSEVESIQMPETDDLKLKKIIYDIHCKSQDGVRFIIEMQKSSDADFLKRLDFYRSRAVATQLVKKGVYKDLFPVVVIAICDFNVMSHFFPDHPHEFYFERIGLYGHNHGRKVDYPTTHILLDLYNYKKKNFPKNSAIEDWFELFSCGDLPRELKTQRKEIETILKDLAYDNLSENEKLIVRAEEDFVGAFISEMATATQIGLKRGIEKGIKKGKQNALREVVANLRQMGLSEQQICDATGLSVQDLKDWYR